jgi:hypothetical protein
MGTRSGIIYDIGEDRFGLAIYSEQQDRFALHKKVYLHVFKDRLCMIPEINPDTNKERAILKDISKIKAIGFAD